MKFAFHCQVRHHAEVRVNSNLGMAGLTGKAARVIDSAAQPLKFGDPQEIPGRSGDFRGLSPKQPGISSGINPRSSGDQSGISCAKSFRTGDHAKNPSFGTKSRR